MEAAAGSESGRKRDTRLVAMVLSSSHSDNRMADQLVVLITRAQLISVVQTLIGTVTLQAV